jgi:hypothetical protein
MEVYYRLNSLSFLNHSHFSLNLNISNSHLREVDVEFLGEPKAGIVKAEVRIVHDQIDGATTGITDVTAVAVAARAESERWVGVIVKRAQAFMMLDREVESISDLLYWQVLKFLDIVL